MRWPEILLFALTGLGMEVVFTGAFAWLERTDKHLKGYSSPWYLPLYGAIPAIFDVIGPRVFPLALLFRGLLYMLGFFLVEYVSMGLLRWLLGSSPSEESYYRSRFNVHGLIRLDFAPAFFFAGLMFEWLYRSLHP